MKKTILLLAVLSTTIVSVSATEPLILEYLTPQEVKEIDSIPQQPQNTMNIDTNIPISNNNVNTNSNMIPQNNAAKGLPVERQVSRINIVTKQGRQTNTQWNPGGKGTRSYF